MNDNQRYTVSIKVALPGTPLMKENGEQDVDSKTNEPKTSKAGHMWYSISDGEKSTSYGFSSVNETPIGPGEAYKGDDEKYHKPYYARTIEITKEQYEKLKEYGDLAVRETDSKLDNSSSKEQENKTTAKKTTVFDFKYNGLSNSCIDFTWEALNSAGLKHSKDAKFEGDLKPANNIDNIKSITAPFPDSELNKEESNDKPTRTPMQRLLSQNQELNIKQATTLMNNCIDYEDLMAICKKINKDEAEKYLSSDPFFKDIKLSQNKKEEEQEKDNIDYHRA
jgi:hypothetical protein